MRHGNRDVHFLLQRTSCRDLQQRLLQFSGSCLRIFCRCAQSSRDHAAEVPRAQDVWGETICKKLLERSPLIVCDIMIEENGPDPQMHRCLCRCTPCQDRPHQWNLEIMAAPLEVLKLQNDSSVFRCLQHNWQGAVDLGARDRGILDIAQCLHLSSLMTKVFWDNILRDTWSRFVRNSSR